MRTLFLILIPVLALCAIPGSADATGCHVSPSYVSSYSYYTPSYSYTPTYATLATTFVPVFVPSYGVGYSGAASTTSTTSGSSADLLQLQLEIERLKGNYKDLQIQYLQDKAKGVAAVAPQAPYQPPPQKAQEPLPKPVGVNPALQIASARCAACHDETNAKAKGNNFLLFKGGRMDHLTPADKLLVQKEVWTGRMPKTGAKLSDQEISVLIEDLIGATPQVTPEKK